MISAMSLFLPVKLSLFWSSSLLLFLITVNSLSRLLEREKATTIVITILVRMRSNREKKESAKNNAKILGATSFTITKFEEL